MILNYGNKEYGIKMNLHGTMKTIQHVDGSKKKDAITCMKRSNDRYPVINLNKI